MLVNCKLSTFVDFFPRFECGRDQLLCDRITGNPYQQYQKVEEYDHSQIRLFTNDYNLVVIQQFNHWLNMN